MNQSEFHGSATILQFHPRPLGPRTFLGRPAEVARLRMPKAVIATSFPVVDIDGWYHEDAMHDAESGKH